MLKDILIIFVIIAVIVGGDFFVREHLAKTTEELVSNLKELKDKTILVKENSEKEEVKEKIKEVEKKWEEINKIWSTVVVHQEIDNIEQALIRAKADINDGNIEDAIPEIDTAIFFAEHINEREQIRLKNIF